MAIITKTRGTKNVSSPVLVALYDAPLNVDWDALATMEPVNMSKAINDQNGIRSTLDLGVVLSDIQGCRVGMLAKEGNTIYRDVVTLKGMTNAGIIVTFDDEPETYYTVARYQVKFVKGVE